MTSPLLKEVKKRERRKLYTWEEIEADALTIPVGLILIVMGFACMILGG